MVTRDRLTRVRAFVLFIKGDFFFLFLFTLNVYFILILFVIFFRSSPRCLDYVRRAGRAEIALRDI